MAFGWKLALQLSLFHSIENTDVITMPPASLPVAPTTEGKVFVPLCSRVRRFGDSLLGSWVECRFWGGVPTGGLELAVPFSWHLSAEGI